MTNAFFVGSQVTVGVKCGSAHIGLRIGGTYIRAGQYAAKPALPYTPGNDAAGTIEVLGPSVVGSASADRLPFTIGQRVYVAGSVSGTYAEKTLALESRVHRLPDHVSFEQG